MPSVDVHEIVPRRLYVGAHPRGWVPKRGEEFDLHVLTARELPKTDLRIAKDWIYVPLDDKPGLVSTHEANMIRDAANRVAAAIVSGERVLVTCHMGINRSATVAARALMAAGNSAEKSIALVRAKRPGTLQNPDFVAWLKAEDR